MGKREKRIVAKGEMGGMWLRGWELGDLGWVGNGDFASAQDQDLRVASCDAGQPPIKSDKHGIVGPRESQEMRVCHLLVSEKRCEGILPVFGSRRGKGFEVDMQGVGDQAHQ